MPSTTRSWPTVSCLVDDPERIGPIQATGMDQTLSNRAGQYPTQQWATTLDSP
jgi:hypothetical protein